MRTMFRGLSAFPPTPADADGVVDTAAVGMLVDRLADAGVDSIGLLGSTGIYAYLDRAQRARAVAAAVEAVAGRVPLIVGVGALRTGWASDLARDTERAGADGLLLAPVSYTPLTDEEAARHYRTVAATTGLPLCIYNNPGTTNFAFSDALIANLAALPNVAAIKMPPAPDDDAASELTRLRQVTPGDFAIGYSGDWAAASSLLSGCDTWYSVVAGLLPAPALQLTRAAQAGDVARTAALDDACEPLSALFRRHGSLRIMYEIADRLSLAIGDPPLPLQRVDRRTAAMVEAALDRLSHTASS